MSSQRALGVDLGEKRIGIAVCDDAGRLAVPYELIRRVGDRTIEHGRLLELVAEVNAHRIVVGLPLSLDGTESSSAGAIRAELRGLRKRLRREGLEVEIVEHDERFSTVEAHRQLAAGGNNSRARRDLVDASAAAVILQSWLDTMPGNTTALPRVPQ